MVASPIEVRITHEAINTEEIIIPNHVHIGDDNAYLTNAHRYNINTIRKSHAQFLSQPLDFPSYGVGSTHRLTGKWKRLSGQRRKSSEINIYCHKNGPVGLLQNIKTEL